MTEEKVTISIIKKLKKNGWKILSFDYPQSGTGTLIKPDLKEKNLGGFIPDIVALKNDIVLFWENKDRFFYDDFVKIKKIKKSKHFIKPIENFLAGFSYKKIYFGVAIPGIDAEIVKASLYFDCIDFFVVVNPKNIVVLHKASNEIIL